jgi:Uma2 family endonuclease
VLADRLRGGPWTAIRGDLKVLAAGRVRYPDAVVTCTPIANDADIVPEPVVVFEVLSSSTASTDRITKNEEYRATSSIARYVMLEQTRIAATVFRREGGRWIGEVFSGATTLAMPEIGVELPLDACCAGLGIDGEDAS